MKKIYLSDELFLFEKPYAKGLVSFLSNSKQEMFLVTEKIIKNNYLIDILKSEDIKIGLFSNENCDKITIHENKIITHSGTYNSFNDLLNCSLPNRISEIERKTKETKIKIRCNLDGNGKSIISTGIGFFDHMLDQIARHSNIDLNINVEGDLNVDEHHTVEDTGIALGECLLKAMDSKKGINRYGFFLPMDETIAKCAIDLGGRTFLNYKCKFKREFIGDFPTELFLEFFRGLAGGMKANIYLRAKGENDHHKAEALFKSLAKSLNSALKFDSRNLGNLPTTKGVL